MKNLRLLAMAFVAISSSVFADLSKNDVVELCKAAPEQMHCIYQKTGVDCAREIAVQKRQAARRR